MRPSKLWRVNLPVSVPGGEFEEVIEIRETSLLELDKQDSKWYAPGVGEIKSADVDEILVLLASTPLGTIPAGIDFWKLMR